MAIAGALVAVTGLLFMLASAARLGGMSDFIARPVLRGFTFGLALTIVIKQLPKILVVPVTHSDTLHVLLDLLHGLPQANVYNLALGAAALAIAAGHRVGRRRQLRRRLETLWHRRGRRHRPATHRPARALA